MFSQHNLYCTIAKTSESAMINTFRQSIAQKVVLERDRKAEGIVSPAVPWGTKTFSLAATLCHNAPLSNQICQPIPSSFPLCWIAPTNYWPFSARTELSCTQAPAPRELWA